MGFVILPGGGTVNSLPATTPPWAQMFDSGITEAWPETGPTAQIIYHVPWDYHYLFAQSLLGQWTGTPPSTVVYTGPYQYPFSTNLMCTSIASIVPFGKPWVSTRIPVPLPYLPRQWTRITANFTRPAWQPAATGGYFKVTFHSSGQFLTVPGSTFFYGSSSGPPVANSQAGIVVAQAEISVIRYRMPFIPDFIMIPLEGTVNGAPFQILNNTYPSGSLMFMCGDTSTEADVLGNITYVVEYKFLFNPVGWNNLITGGSSTAGFIVTPIVDANNNPPYYGADYDTLP